MEKYRFSPGQYGVLSHRRVEAAVVFGVVGGGSYVNLDNRAIYAAFSRKKASTDWLSGPFVRRFADF